MLQEKMFTEFLGYRSHLMDLWKSKNTHRTEKSQKAMLEVLFGNSGVSPDMMVLYLNSVGIKTEIVRTNNVACIKDGFLQVQIGGQNGFAHAIAIRDGWIIDSIITHDNLDGVYKNNGVIRGYGKQSKVITMARRIVK